LGVWPISHGVAIRSVGVQRARPIPQQKMIRLNPEFTSERRL
jgi:hypothetical protein